MSKGMLGKRHLERYPNENEVIQIRLAVELCCQSEAKTMLKTVEP